MKVKQKPSSLSRRKLREVERELEIFLDSPKTQKRTDTQQFGVYDEDEVYAGDITSSGSFFTETELYQAIHDLFREINTHSGEES